MFGLFRKSVYSLKTISEMKGVYQDCEVTLKNCPFKEENQTKKRKFAKKDFGYELITDLTENQLPPYKRIKEVLPFQYCALVNISFESLPAFQVELKCTPGNSEEQFYSDLADSLIEAFESE